MKQLRFRRFIYSFVGVLVTAVAVAAFATPPVGTRPQVALAAAIPPAQTPPIVEFKEIDGQIDVSEGVGTAQLRVVLSAASTTVVTISYDTIDGTAVGIGSSKDYTAVTAGVLTFNPDEIEKDIPIIIIDDTPFEPLPHEFFYVQLINPVGATLGSPNRLKINIQDNEATPTNTPVSPATPTPGVFIDLYEPNDSLTDAYTTAAGATALCNATLWPSGDVDYYRFVAKKDSYYSVFTHSLIPGLDTEITVYDTNGDNIGSNDDAEPSKRESRFEFRAREEGFYFVRVTNKDPSDSTNKTYCLEIDEDPIPTPTVSNTPVSGADSCEFNSTIEYACEIGVGQKLALSFVPTLGSHQDTDILRLWVKPNITYTCETLELAPVTDTNIIFLDKDGKDFQPNLGNDDKAPGDLGSKLSYRATYTGWLHIMIGPVNPPAYEDSSKHTYSVICTSEAATPTPTLRPTVPGSSGGAGGVATPTPFQFPTPLPTPTPIDFSIFNTPTLAPPPVVVFVPLPTSTPISGGQQLTSANVTVYYDSNGNFTPEINEGVMDVAVAMYDNVTGQLLAFGYTNDVGMIRFESIATSGAVRIVVPFLNYSQVAVGNEANILVRIAPQPLPIGIP